MTARRALFWLVLLPLTIGVWAQVLLPRPSTPPAYVEKLREPEVQRVHICSYGGNCWWHPDPPEPEPVPSTLPPVRPVSSYTVCGIAGADNCWEVGRLIPRGR